MNVAGVRAGDSLGIAAYCDRLAASLRDLGVDYTPTGAPVPGGANHLHLGNSSRKIVVQSLRLRRPFVVTVHDVVPRDRRLMPLYRAAVYPAVARRAAVLIAHSEFAADMLAEVAGIRPARVQVVPHPVTLPGAVDRLFAREQLGWATDEIVAVLPGVLKGAKLLDAAVEAARGLDGMRLVLAGRVSDPGMVERARAAGASVLADPDDDLYRRAVVGADVVLVLRDGSVGETNGPLLDALGAGRAVIATRTGSIPEVARGAAILVEPNAGSIREALARALDSRERAILEARSVDRARTLTPEVAARTHAEIFAEVFDAA